LDCGAVVGAGADEGFFATSAGCAVVDGGIAGNFSFGGSAGCDGAAGADAGGAACGATVGGGAVCETATLAKHDSKTNDELLNNSSRLVRIDILIPTHRVP
jgi:hypothetical protein